MKNIEKIIQIKCFILTILMYINKIVNINASVVINICNLIRDALKHANVVDINNL